MKEVATRQHAHANTVYHCLYAYYKFGYSKKHRARIFNKSERAIRNWVNVYQNTETFQRVNPASKRQFTDAQRRWLFDYYHEHPLTYLREAKTTIRQHLKDFCLENNSRVWAHMENFRAPRNAY
ncbi:hypothetical protein F443_20796 [Phytophthora nicotianae P1569]|uniref:Uncharacterized protein n=1 Tax=Phytophthora nicotianae P1569 TaxID=1317065 RepID=V9E0E6_PHYNI|nr:hypothetical protein F443_20796 [Phytophthora nicotianae P1569]